MKMNPEVKALWVADLRSGLHAQTKGCLNRGDSFCCLGRLTDIYINSPANDVGMKWEQADPIESSGKMAVYENHSATSFLSTAILKWAGLGRRAGEWVNVDKELSEKIGLIGANYSLSHLNDQGVTFLQIADIIEAQL